jgi:SAM-dependent methyltransferase
MGDLNQIQFIRQNSQLLTGPYLEVGSKKYKKWQDIKGIFSDAEEYIGVDMEPGPGVDIVLDLTEDFDVINRKLDGRSFGTIICLSVLEHCQQPFKMAENLCRLLKPGGNICISAPFAWEFHGYPSDYWRFTHEGVKKLFPRLAFDFDKGASSTSKKNDFRSLDEEIGKIHFSFKYHWKNQNRTRAISAKILKMLSGIKVMSWLSGYRYVMAPTMINMIGTLREMEDYSGHEGSPEKDEKS